MGDAGLQVESLREEDYRCKTFLKDQFDAPAEQFFLRKNKTFTSVDSLRDEVNRLDTFIDWPLTFITPAELAREGFYYLRHKDHCACIFCRGIIGAWEVGDTPRGEHLRHFSHCPFLRHRAVGNVPTQISNIISEDVCGISNRRQNNESSRNPVLEENNEEFNFKKFGLSTYHGPVRPEYFTLKSRLSSFNHWPAEITQKPQELAEAGFFSCGLSDHVKCFHCGNGLRNWEKNDDVWEEHARWYPNCHFVQLKKGQAFVDEVLKISGHKSDVSQGAGSMNTNHSKNISISEDKLNKLMELDVITAVVKMGLPEDAVKTALKNRLLETGQPFSTLESCIEGVLQYAEEVPETKITSKRMPEEMSPSTSPEVSPPSTPTEVFERPIELVIPPIPIAKKVQKQKKQKLESDQAKDEHTNETTECEKEETNSTENLIKEIGLLKEKIGCKICMDSETTIVFLPCRHMLTCSDCALAFTNCPLCRKEIEFAFQPIKS